jgi:hypothetical protein
LIPTYIPVVMGLIVVPVPKVVAGVVPVPLVADKIVPETTESGNCKKFYKTDAFKY